MTQKELAEKVGVGNSLISRIESGERWPSAQTWANLHVSAIGALGVGLLRRLKAAQLRTWRAYSPDRKGKRP